MLRGSQLVEVPLPDSSEDTRVRRYSGADEFVLRWIEERVGPSERRQIVVLVCGAMHKAVAGGRHDPEDLAAELSERRLIFAGIASRFGGVIARANLETQIAYWGSPVAREDDARLALAAALEVVARLGDFCRCALDAGIGIAERRAASGVRVVADAFLSARAILQHAEAGEVVVGRGARPLLEDCCRLSPFDVRGGDGAADVAWSIAVLPDREPLGGLLFSTLRGRESELARLVTLWREVEPGEGRQIFVRGECGIGKSALLSAFRTALAGEAVVTLEANCRPEVERASGAAIDSIAVAAGRWPAGTRHPAVVVVEDVQWADGKSLEQLARIGRDALRDGRFLIVTGRTGLPEPLAKSGRWSTLELGPLPAEAVADIVAGTPAGASLTRESRQSIAERAEGHPLLALALAADGIAATSDVAVLAQPSRLNSILLARLDGAGEMKPLLQAAAVLGNNFSAALLAAMLLIDPAAIATPLTRLVTLGLLRRGPANASTFQFARPFLQPIAYASLSRLHGRELHARAAAELTIRFRDWAQYEPEIVAHHLDAAGDRAAAFGWWRRAAHLAAARGDPNLVAGFAERALSALAAAPEAGSAAAETELLTLLGHQLGLMTGEGSPETVTAYQRAMGLLSATPSRPDDDLSFEVRWGVCAAHLVSGETENALEISSALREEARRSGRRDRMVLAARLHGTGSLLSGRVREAIECLRSAHDHYDDRVHDLLGYRHGSDQGVVATAHLAWATAIAGDGVASRAAQYEALALAARLGHPHTSANALGILATSALLRGEAPTANALARACQEVAVAHGFVYWSIRAQLALSWAASLRAPELALPVAQDASASYRSTGSGRAGALAGCIEADIALRAGRPDLAIAALGRAEAAGAHRTHRVYTAEVFRLRALALAALDPAGVATAVQLLLKAEAIAVQQDALTFARRASSARASLVAQPSVRSPSLTRAADV